MRITPPSGKPLIHYNVKRICYGLTNTITSYIAPNLHYNLERLSINSYTKTRRLLQRINGVRYWVESSSLLLAEQGILQRCYQILQEVSVLQDFHHKSSGSSSRLRGYHGFIIPRIAPHLIRGPVELNLNRVVIERDHPFR